MVMLGLGVILALGGAVALFTSKPGEHPDDDYREDGYNSPLASNKGRIAGLFMVGIGILTIVRHLPQ